MTVDHLKLSENQTLKIVRNASDVLQLESTWQPGGKPPPTHWHPHQAEHFEVLEGGLTVRLGGEEPRVLSAARSSTYPPARRTRCGTPGRCPAGPAGGSPRRGVPRRCSGPSTPAPACSARSACCGRSATSSASAHPGGDEVTAGARLGRGAQCLSSRTTRLVPTRKGSCRRTRRAQNSCSLRSWWCELRRRWPERGPQPREVSGPANLADIAEVAD